MIYKLVTTDEMNELLGKRIDYLVHVLNTKTSHTQNGIRTLKIQYFS